MFPDLRNEAEAEAYAEGVNAATKSMNEKQQKQFENIRAKVLEKYRDDELNYNNLYDLFNDLEKEMHREARAHKLKEYIERAPEDVALAFDERISGALSDQKEKFCEELSGFGRQISAVIDANLKKSDKSLLVKKHFLTAIEDIKEKFNEPTR